LSDVQGAVLAPRSNRIGRSAAIVACVAFFVATTLLSPPIGAQEPRAASRSAVRGAPPSPIVRLHRSPGSGGGANFQAFVFDDGTYMVFPLRGCGVSGPVVGRTDEAGLRACREMAAEASAATYRPQAARHRPMDELTTFRAGDSGRRRVVFVRDGAGVPEAAKSLSDAVARIVKADAWTTVPDPAIVARSLERIASFDWSVGDDAPSFAVDPRADARPPHVDDPLYLVGTEGGLTARAACVRLVKRADGEAVDVGMRILDVYARVGAEESAPIRRCAVYRAPKSRDGAASSSPASRPRLRPDDAITVVRRSSTASRPDYRLRVSASGAVEYEGFRGVLDRGPRRVRSSPEDVAEVSRLVVESGWAYADGEMRIGVARGCGELELTAEFDGRRILVECGADFGGAAADMRRLAGDVETAVGVERWVGRRRPPTARLIGRLWGDPEHRRLKFAEVGTGAARAAPTYASIYRRMGGVEAFEVARLTGVDRLGDGFVRGWKAYVYPGMSLIEGDELWEYDEAVGRSP
jgi:hypothetical protein